jgi:hypothetical protein
MAGGMEIVRSEWVEQASELPSLVLVLAAGLGPLFWVLGWRIHRALFVAVSTLVGGVYGLVHGPSFGLYPALAAGLLSLSAAGLALALLRIGVFIAVGGLASLVAGETVGSHTDEATRGWIRVVAFLAGGLMSLVCYRMLVILCTSFTGAFLLLVGGLAFAARQGNPDAMAVAADRPALLSAALVLLGLVGVAAQYWVERSRAPRPAK